MSACNLKNIRKSHAERTLRRYFSSNAIVTNALQASVVRQLRRVTDKTPFVGGPAKASLLHHCLARNAADGSVQRLRDLRDSIADPHARDGAALGGHHGGRDRYHDRRCRIFAVSLVNVLVHSVFKIIEPVFMVFEDLGLLAHHFVQRIDGCGELLQRVIEIVGGRRPGWRRGSR